MVLVNEPSNFLSSDFTVLFFVLVNMELDLPEVNGICFSFSFLGFFCPFFEFFLFNEIIPPQNFSSFFLLSNSSPVSNLISP